MKRKTVTRSLKKTLKKLGIKYRGSFSDGRKNKKAVGVKFIGLDLDDEPVGKILMKMEKKGYEFVRVTHKKKYNHPMLNHFTGTRLTFYKKEYSRFID
jgi:hypothetical protein